MELTSQKAILKVYDNEKNVAINLCRFILQTANDAISTRGVFTIGLSGGSAAKYLIEHVPTLEIKTDWSKWRIFFCDERHVTRDDPECTFQLYDKNLFQAVQIPSSCIFPSDPNVPVEEAARSYADSMRTVFGDVLLPRFDLLLLGMGPDGHTCSLFPEHHLLDEEESWVVAVNDSPKPPPERITFTFPVLLNAHCAVFAACGAGKAAMVQRILEGKEEPLLPAARVRPHHGQLYWFLDASAASLLNKTS